MHKNLKKNLVRLIFPVAIALCAFGIDARASELDAAEWMIPKICADTKNQPVAVDPYGGCPQGMKLRPLADGDPLPYRKLDQTSLQYKDVYPRVAADGSNVLVLTFDWIDPKNGGASTFKIWQDGYDAYAIRDGWASGSETRIGTGEYGTTFMGAGCKPYGGLIFMPEHFERTTAMSGSAKVPTATAAWEESGENWPGACPSRYVADQLTTWTHYSSLDFGGVGGVPRRSLEAIVTTMGLRQSPDPKVMSAWMSYGHLEVFYFTRLYGLTRWESWTPDSQFSGGGRESASQTQQRAAGVSGRCLPLQSEVSASFTPAGSTSQAERYTMAYQGMQFTMTDCRDWTNIVVQSPPVQPPAWPVSALNLLRNFHFSDGSNKELVGWNTGLLKHAGVQLSDTKDDTTRDTPKPLRGVAYLRFACSGGCGEKESLFQDIPIAATAPKAALYTLGAVVRSEAGAGKLEIELAQLAADHAVLSKSEFTADLTAQQAGCDSHGGHCKTYSYDRAAGTGSIVLSSNFVSRTFPVTLAPGARILRFSLTPRSNTDMDAVSAWLMRTQ
jgi:hypothetical protein